MTISEPLSMYENEDLMNLEFNLLNKKTEAARIKNWCYHKEIAKSYDKRIRTRTFQEGD